MPKCPVCRVPCRPKKHRSLIQRITGFGRSKHKRVTPSIYENPRFAQTEVASIASTIRRIPSISPILQTTSIEPPSIITLDISLKCDTQNIDAQKGGECTVRCNIGANFTLPPSSDRSKGFDGVMLFDTSLPGRKFTLAIDAVGTIIDATSSNDRLGLVLFGDGDASTISELIMCTTPYKQALKKSLQEIKSTTSSNTFREGMKLALNLLMKDARYGGHIFLISDGTFPVSFDIARLWSISSTTIHTIAIGSLIHPTTLRHIRHQNGSFLEFRSLSSDSTRLAQLVAYIATQTHLHSIETVRCRLTFPTQVNVLEILNHPTWSPESKSQISLTLSPIPTPCFRICAEFVW